MSFTISETASGPRLSSDQRLSADVDFEAIIRDLATRGSSLFQAVKAAPVAARQIPEESRDILVRTCINGSETINTAKPSDWIVTSLDIDARPMQDRQGMKNVYVVKDDRFHTIYDLSAHSTEDGIICHPKGEKPIDVLAFPGGFDIVAPWGERQQASSGVIVRKAGDVYGIHIEAFQKTYRICD